MVMAHRGTCFSHLVDFTVLRCNSLYTFSLEVYILNCPACNQYCSIILNWFNKNSHFLVDKKWWHYSQGEVEWKIYQILTKEFIGKTLCNFFRIPIPLFAFEFFSLIWLEKFNFSSRCIPVSDRNYNNWHIIKNCWRMNYSLNFTRKYNLLGLFRFVWIKGHFPLVGPIWNFLKII